ADALPGNTVIRRNILPVLAVCASLALSACNREPSPTDAAAPGTPQAAPADETADQFIARVTAELKAMYPAPTAAQWLSSPYIIDDSQLLAARANEQFLTSLNGWIEPSRRFLGPQMSPDTARAINLLKLGTAMPAPRDPARLAELTRIATRMEGMYGSGTYCSDPSDPASCRQLGALEEVLRKNRDYEAQLDAWQGWHGIAQPMRDDYRRFVELVNEGARELGYADAGEMWRSGYDMSPVELAAETDRLWGQVKPL